MAKVVKKPFAALYPTPGVLVSCGTGPSANVITLAWAGVVCSVPPMVGIAVRPSRHSHALISELGEFVVNLPTAAQARYVDLCGHISGRDQDKWARCGFTQEPPTQVRVPLIGECPVNLECVVRETHRLGSHDLFIGEVVAVHLDDSILDARGHLDVARVHALACIEGHYFQVGDSVGSYGFSQKD